MNNTESKHTPGPWRKYTVVQSSHGQDTCAIMADSMKRTICYVNQYPETEDNLSLIAAAPELLAVAEKAAQAWTDWKSGADVRDLLEALQTMARAAIAKATKE